MKTIGDGWTDRLSEYLDGELSRAERAALESHLEGCVSCRTTLGTLEAVRNRAAALEDVAPARDLWPGIAARIAAEGEAQRAPRSTIRTHEHVWRRRFALSLPQLAAAALVVALLGGGSALLLSRGQGPASSTQAATPASSDATGSARFAAERQASDEDMDRAVADLQSALAKERSRLDPATLRVVDRNLATIDSALVQIRQALHQRPTDGYLNRSLTSTMLQKLNVLRTAVRMAGATT